MRIARAGAVAILALLWSGVAHAQTLECRGAQKAQQVAELMLGRKIGERLGVSETQWSGFVDREITPRFPDGLTVLPAPTARTPSAGDIL